jgi:two-component system, NtrC family, sensor histidine kinase KinB
LRTQQTTQLAIDSLPDTVFIIGPNEMVEISNRTACDLFGIKPGMKVAELARLKWLAPLYEGARDGHQSEPPRGYQSAVQVFDGGQERFLLPRAVPMIAADKTPIGVTLILVDVTRLRMADEAKSSVVSTVSHELRTPLTSIRMALSLLMDGKFAAKTPQQVTLLTAARQDADRLYRIIENLMNISRLESGRAAFHLRPTSPADLIAQAVDPLRAAFGEKNISLAIDVPENIGHVLADSAAVGSAMTNLLTNALKYSPAGGAVRVSACGADEFIAFTVSDTGPGIPEQYAPRIFDKFFRVPSKEGPTGAGLGLAIAKEVVEAHGGTLILSQPNGPGSEFRFTLRQCNRPAESAAPAASAASV